MADDDVKDLTIEFAQVTDEELMALAQFVKRVGWQEMRGCAVDDDETYQIRSAVGKLQDALADKGYAPR